MPKKKAKKSAKRNSGRIPKIVGVIVRTYHGLDSPEDRFAMHKWQESLPKGKRARYDAYEAAYEMAGLGNYWRSIAGPRP